MKKKAGWTGFRLTRAQLLFPFKNVTKKPNKQSLLYHALPMSFQTT